MSKRHVHPISNLKPLSYVSPKLSLTLSPPSTLRPILTFAVGRCHDGGRDFLCRPPYWQCRREAGEKFGY